MNAVVHIKKRYGFTLIELLVVVAIIAVLIAILLPSLQEARLSAQWLNNGSHLRAIGEAHFFYANDYDDWLPPASMSGQHRSHRMFPWWPLLSGEYVQPVLLGSPLTLSGDQVPSAYYMVVYKHNLRIDYRAGLQPEQFVPIAFESWAWPDVWYTRSAEHRLNHSPEAHGGEAVQQMSATTKLAWQYEWDVPKRYGSGHCVFLDGHVVKAPTESYTQWIYGFMRSREF